MSLSETIKTDLKTSLKEKREFETGVLRLLASVFQNKEIEKKGKGLEPRLSDEEIIEILTREAKKRKEAAEIYKQGNRDDLAKKEIEESEIIKKYLPEQLGEEEITKIIEGIIQKSGVVNQNDFGRVMGEAMKELKGKADAKLVSEIVKKKLETQL
mgnify:FL=1